MPAPEVDEEPDADDAAFAAALAFVAAVDRGAADEVRAHPLGEALLTPRLPHAWFVNALRVDAAVAPALTPQALGAALDELYAGVVAHRRAVIADDAAGRRLAEALRPDGWTAEPTVAMILRRPRDRPTAPGLAVQEAGEDRLRALEARAYGDSPPGLEAALRAAAAATPSRFLIARADGQDAAGATLFLRDGVGQVENVTALESHRGRGLGRAVVAAAVDTALAAGCDLVFLIADADDWPRELYRKLGFDVVGQSWTLTRLPPTTPAASSRAAATLPGDVIAALDVPKAAGEPRGAAG